RRVREVGDIVLGLVATRGAGRGGGEVSVVADHLAGLAGRFLERRLEGHRVVAGIRTIVPGDLERAAPLHGRPGVASDDRDATNRVEVGGRRTVLDLDDTLDARHLERLGGVEARHLAAIDGRTRDHGVEHAGKASVDAVLRLAADDVAAIDQLQLALADVAELFRILETQRLPARDRLTGGSLGERSVAEAPARGAMHDLVVLGFHLAHWHLPAFGGGRLQHGAR